LIARLPGFSEARYGFGRFKDLVDAAEAAGILTSTDVGQVQWVSLPDTDGAAPPAPATPLPAAAPTPALAAPASEPADDAAAAARSIDLAEAVSAIVEMRHRTRLLTQSYVLSNL